VKKLPKESVPDLKKIIHVWENQGASLGLSFFIFKRMGLKWMNSGVIPNMNNEFGGEQTKCSCGTWTYASETQILTSHYWEWKGSIFH
jgi:hypothetical protein